MSRQASYLGAFSPEPSRFFFPHFPRELCNMHLLYIDESGTSDIPGNTSHFVLAGISIPIEYWKAFDTEIGTIKKKYDLEDKEIHVGWLLRKYLEQDRIPNFSTLNYVQRIAEVQ
jgi:hypothetical protein